MKNRMIHQVVFTVAVAAICCSGTTMRALESDKDVDAAFKNTYVYKTYLKDDTIKTSTQEGVVTLTGTVADQASKTLAQDTMENISGVKRVDNQLQTQAENEAENADKWITRKVNLALLFRWDVSALNTLVKVEDGVVTLTGEASSDAQKELTGQYAGDIQGVVKVKNEMTVAATPEPAELTAGVKMDDASVTAQIRTALTIHTSTSALRTKVKTRDGNVTLTGIAKNAAEKTLVTKLVSDIKGVSSVNNEMTVQAK